jgi:hypothetical protein
MDFLRRVRLSRSDADVNGAADASGLDAFGTEDTMAAPAPGEPVVLPQQAPIAIAVLAALVLIEAVPAALWIRLDSVRPPSPNPSPQPHCLLQARFRWRRASRRPLPLPLRDQPLLPLPRQV